MTLGRKSPPPNKHTMYVKFSINIWYARFDLIG